MRSQAIPTCTRDRLARVCGIVGYVGTDKSLEVLLGGLKRLEYRGYDSAGIAVIGPDGSLGTAKYSM